MACGCKKGGAKTVGLAPARASSNDTTQNSMVLMEYVGEQKQKQRLSSKVMPREKYVFSGEQRKFYAYPKDAEWLANMPKQFKVAQVVREQASLDSDGTPKLQSDLRVPKTVDIPLEALDLDPITIGLLRKKFNTVSEVRYAGRAEWMTISQIGAKRADEIEKALNALKV